MAEADNITLDFIAKQQRQLLEEMGELRDDMRVVAAMVQRLDGQVRERLGEEG